MRKKLIKILSVLLITALLFGCASKKETDQVPSGEYDASSVIEDSEIPVVSEDDQTSVPEVVSYDVKDGPIFITKDSQSDNGKWSLYLYSLKTGERYHLFSFDEQSYIREFGFSLRLAIDQWSAGNYFHRQLFDSKAERLAVTWTDKSDKSSHVGWLDKNGFLTDVTEIVHPASSGFSSVTPKDSNALFTSDDRLVFYDQNQDVWCYFDEDTQSISETFEWTTATDAYCYDGTGFAGLNETIALQQPKWK